MAIILFIFALSQPCSNAIFPIEQNAGYGAIKNSKLDFGPKSLNSGYQSTFQSIGPIMTGDFADHPDRPASPSCWINSPPEKQN